MKNLRIVWSFLEIFFWNLIVIKTGLMLTWEIIYELVSSISIFSEKVLFLFCLFLQYKRLIMPGGNEPKAKKRRKGGDRKDKEKPLLVIQVNINFSLNNHLFSPPASPLLNVIFPENLCITFNYPRLLSHWNAHICILYIYIYERRD